jgi:hypothetical protein
MAEVLAPLRMDISQEFSMGFDGMTDVPVTLGDLQEAREAVVTRIVGGTPEHHRRFLISTKLGEPDWNLLDLPGAEGLPAVRWRLENLAKMDEKKRAKLLRRLSEVLGMGK